MRRATIPVPGNAFDSGRALIGAPGADATGTDSGAAYVFGVVQPTLISVSDSPDPSNAGDPYTVSVVVTCDPASLPCVPTGTVDVGDGDGATCQVTLTPDVPNLGASGSCQLTSIAPGPHTVSADYTGTLLFGTSSNTTSHDVIGADVAVTKSDNSENIVAGSVVTYSIVVSNPGDFPAVGVQVIDEVDGSTDNLNLSNASWTCVAQAGGTCPIPPVEPATSTSWSIWRRADKSPSPSPPTVAANLLPGDFVDNTVDIVPPVGFDDLNINNDTATDSDDVVDNLIFADGFEDPAP
jgi:uncharacterized repeat protein (TIGR01451 family)